MAVTKKIIGRLPVFYGSYYPKEGGWARKNRVTLFGSEFESKIENNTYAPATYDEITNTVTFNTDYWDVVSNGTDAWLASDKIEALGYYVENPEWIRVLIDADDHILAGIKADGSVEWSIGVPTPVKEYITEHLAEITADVTEGLATKVDKEDGKSLVDSEFAGGISYIENPEFVAAYLDSEERILFGLHTDGNFYFGAGVPKQIVDYIEDKFKDVTAEDIKISLESDTTIMQYLKDTYGEYVENPEWLEIKIDADGRIIRGTKPDGTTFIGKLSSPEIDNIVHDMNNLDYYNVTKRNIGTVEITVYSAAGGWEQIAYDSTAYPYDESDTYNVGEVCNVSEDTAHSYKATARNKGIYPCVEGKETVVAEKLTLETALAAIDSNIKATFTAGQIIVFLDTDDIIEKWELQDDNAWQRVSPYEVSDKEGRHEITLDSEDKIVSYRKEDGTKVENVGIESPKITTNSLNLSEDGMTEFQQALKDSGFNPSVVKTKDYNLPKFGYTNIVSEIFYLTADSRYLDKSGIYLIRDYPDTNENARNHVTLDYFYIKSTLTDNGDGTYSKNENSVKLDFYPAGKVTNINDKFYVISSLGEEGEVLSTSTEVTQIVDVPHINAWPVNKKDEHYCGVTIDFGHYLSGTFSMGIKFQGSSTLNYRKKNFRFTFYKSAAKPYYPYDDDKFGKKEKVKIGEFVRLSGFNLKANWTDSTRVKEALMYRLIEAVWNVEGASDNYPWSKEHTAYTGATGIIKGFPIECNVGGEYYGYDFFSLKKDGKNYLLDKDKDGMFECGTRGNVADLTNWTNAQPRNWEDELNDEEDWVIENQTQSNYDALTEFFAFINGRLYKAEDGSTYLVSQVTKVGSKFYVTSTLTPGEGSVTATRTNDPAYVGSDDNLYILSELTEISGTLYVTATLVDGQPTADSVTATLVTGGHNIYLGTDGERYLSSDLITINGVKYVPSKIVWDTTNATEVTLIPFDKKTMPERMSIEHWLKYIVCMQVFLMRDNTCRNMVLYTGSDKKKFYPFFYDLDLSWPNATYNQDIMIPAGEPGSASYAADMSLWENFKNEWWDEIINCYHVLRDKVLNIPYMKAVLNSITEGVPNEVLEKERIKWGTAVSSFEDNLLIMESRLKWLDEEYYK